MFYVKDSIGEGVSLAIDIGNDNVFCRCATCGREIQIDLVDLLSIDGTDLCSTQVHCEKCTEESMRHIGK